MGQWRPFSGAVFLGDGELGFFWPENPVAYVLMGLGDLLWNWQRGVLLGPHEPIEANNHYLETLSVPQNRPGQYIELDRVRYARTPEGQQVLNVWNAEQIRIERLEHADGFRDNASYLGRLLIAALWLKHCERPTANGQKDETDRCRTINKRP